MRRFFSALRQMYHAQRLANMSNAEYAAFLRSSGVLYRMGRNCSISPRAKITDPAYVRMGDNVRLSECTLFGHDGSINMINEAEGTSFDSVGKIDIGSNVFIGHGAVIGPGVTIGDNVIVGMGAIVTRDLPGGYVYAGVPARPIRTYADHVARKHDQHRRFAWADLVERRRGSFDAALEPVLVDARVRAFYPAEQELIAAE